MSEIENLENRDDEIFDEAENDDTIIPERYAITSFGADYDVEGIVKRLDRGDIFIPTFQRDYIWNLKEASRFIESLLLGLPVPGIFLAKEKDSNKLYVVDGQQRIKTLQFFFKGVFNPKEDDKTQKKFKLIRVQKKYDGKMYANLEESDRITLHDSIIHATIIKQDSPEDDDTSVYHVFERLNTGGRKLYPQEIRTAVYYGNLIELLNKLNQDIYWRKIFGKVHNRLKDQELILRFLALDQDLNSYIKPMNEFLSIYCRKYRNINSQTSEEFTRKFTKTIRVVYDMIGESAFRPERTLNTAVFDAVMVGIWRRLSEIKIKNKQQFEKAYYKLTNELKETGLANKATSDESNVKKRIKLAIDYFRNVN